jgi:hypothetical protein
MRETERYLKKIKCSLEQAIELLGMVGQGKIRVGKVELITESEVEQTIQPILDLFKGH